MTSDSHGRCKPSPEDIYTTLKGEIVQGDMVPGERLKEVALSERFGVSRTPVRQALFQLQKSGYLRSDRGRGFTVRELSAEEVREIYPILWTLESLALHETGVRLPSVTGDLEQLNRKFDQASDPYRKMRFDIEFHQRMVSLCPNRYLLKLLDDVRLLVQRYERAYMHDTALTDISVSHHDQIIAFLKRENLEGAISLLEAHWRFGMDSILSALKLGMV